MKKFRWMVMGCALVGGCAGQAQGPSPAKIAESSGSNYENAAIYHAPEELSSAYKEKQQAAFGNAQGGFEVQFCRRTRRGSEQMESICGNSGRRKRASFRLRWSVDPVAGRRGEKVSLSRIGQYRRNKTMFICKSTSCPASWKTLCCRSDRGTKLVLIKPELYEVFPSGVAVNHALRILLKAGQAVQTKPQKQAKAS